MRGLPLAWQSLHQRVSGDFYLGLVFLFVVLTTVTLLPFVIFRLAVGHYFAALGTGLVVLIALAVFTYCWRTSRTEGPRRLVVVAMTVASTYLSVEVVHVPYWTFATLVSNFMLVPWRFALPVNALMLLAVLVGASFFGSTYEMVSYAAVMIMVAMFSLIFVIITNFHRDRLNEMVSRDALTGALNRRVLRADLSDAIGQFDRFGQPAVLALLDLDDFKRVNDTHGHDVGDIVLVDLTRLVERQRRKADRFYRLGGEEFALLLNHTDQDGAMIALNKLIKLVRAELKSPSGPVTVSIGVAAYQAGEPWAEWLARADRAMYQAKRAGKDQIVVGV